MLNSLFSISNRNSFKRSKIKWYPSTQDVYKRIAKTKKKRTEIENLVTNSMKVAMEKIRELEVNSYSVFRKRTLR